MEQNFRNRPENGDGSIMLEQEWKALSVEDKIKITNIVIGVGGLKAGERCDKPLRYPIRLTPEVDLYTKEKEKKK